MPLPEYITRDRASLEVISRQKAIGVYYGNRCLLCRLLGEYLAFVDVLDLMLGPRLVLDGFWEPWVTLALARHLRPGMVCIDVGANYGYYSILFAAACCDANVIACEPNPMLANDYLRRNLALNGFHHTKIYQAAISNVSVPEIDFVLHREDFATSSLTPWAYDHCETVIKTPAMTLDEIVANLPRLDVVKIDAEGAEYLVWLGMQETIRRFPDAVIVIELHIPRDAKQAAMLLDEAEAIGYTLCTIDYSGNIIRVNKHQILSLPHEHWHLWLSRD